MDTHSKLKVISGVKWTSASAVLVGLIDFLRVAVLANILSPNDFGLLGMLTIFVGFAQAFADMGVSNVIIQKQDANDLQLSTLYWLNIGVSFLLGLILISVSPSVAAFYAEPRLTGLLPLLAINFFIAPFGQQFQSLMRKKLKFDVLAKADVLSSLVTFLVSVGFALGGTGVYSLIFGALAGQFVRVWALVMEGVKSWRPCLSFNLGATRGFWVFGLYQMGERSVNYLTANLDYLFVGKILGAQALGIYTLAYQLVVMPFAKINPVLTRVAFPVFSRYQHDNMLLKNGYLQMLKLIAFVVFPLLVGLAAVAQDFIPAVYGAGWVGAVPVIQILVITGMLKALGNPIGSILLAKGRADIGFKWNIFVVAVNAVSFYYAARHGIYAVAWTWNILCILYLVLTRQILNFLLGLEWREFLLPIYPILAYSLAMGGGVYLCGIVIKGVFHSEYVSLAIQIGLGVGIYCACVFYKEGDYVQRLKTLLLSSAKAVNA